MKRCGEELICQLCTNSCKYLPTLTIYTGLGTTTYYISPFFDRELPKAVLIIAKFIQAQLKLNVLTYEMIIIS